MLTTAFGPDLLAGEAPQDDGPSAVTNLEGVLDSLDRLHATLGGFADPDGPDAGRAMQGLASFFQATGAALYAAQEPDDPMMLVADYLFPHCAPRALLGQLQDGIGNSNRPLIRLHLGNDYFAAWTQAAHEAGWTDLLVYLLPGCTARLVLAYTEVPRRLPATMSKLTLRALAAALRNRLSMTESGALRRERDQLHHLVVSGIDFVKEGVLWLDAQARVAECNSQAEEMLGYLSGEIIGLAATEVLISRTNLADLLRPVLEGTSALRGHHLTLYRRDGKPLHVRLRMVPMRLPAGDVPFGAMVLLADMHAEPMVEVEKQLREENARLESTMALLAHEVRNPLTGILAGLDFIKPSIADPEAVVDLEQIKGQVRRLDRLLRDALLVSRACELQPRPQQIADLLDDLLSGRQQLLDERGITLQKQYAALPLVHIDRAQMEHVLENLVVNAIQAMETGGVLTITGEVKEKPMGAGRAPRTEVHIKVCDTGAGIPPENRDRIFDAFFTTKQGGTGLGLAVVRRIVGLHNGSVQVESWPGAGSIFSVVLPVEE